MIFTYLIQGAYKMDTKFIVWVGGVPDYEGNSLRDAKAVYKEWIDLDYDDVILEEITQ